MSGYAGIVSSAGETPDSNLLERMAARLAFRGPDATQIWSRPGAGFCFTFLRTGPAPQASQQPCTLDGRVWLLGDIRLDGRDEVIRRLEQAGESLEANVTDEELVLREWRRRGEDCLPDLLGDFAFAIWDEQERKLWCTRDLMGARPFFYAVVNGKFFFSNTLEALRFAPGLSSTLDPVFIGDFLLQESCLDAWRTAFRDIRRLPPGHLLRYSNSATNVTRFAELSIEEPLHFKRPDEYVERFRNLLEQAVSDRLPREPSAIFLSGGLDSTSVAAIATQIGKQRGVPGLSYAHTADCRPLFDDQEGTLATLIAKHLGLEIEILSGVSTLPYEGWDRPLRTPEPMHDPFLALSRKQYEQAAVHARVIFTGYGGDDVLTGQAWPYLVYLLRRGQFVTLVKSFGGYMLKHRQIPPLRGGFRTRLRRLMGRTDPMLEFPVWLSPKFVNELHLRERWLGQRGTPKKVHPLHPLGHASLASESSANWSELEDTAWTSVAAEIRSPLLDLRILRFLLRVPPVPWCMNKALLRETMRELLPDEIRARPKTPLPVELVDAFAEGNRWTALSLPRVWDELGGFVDSKQLAETLRLARGSTLWVGLRPVSLGYWLKGVEN